MAETQGGPGTALRMMPPEEFFTGPQCLFSEGAYSLCLLLPRASQSRFLRGQDAGGFCWGLGRREGGARPSGRGREDSRTSCGANPACPEGGLHQLRLSRRFLPLVHTQHLGNLWPLRMGASHSPCFPTALPRGASRSPPPQPAVSRGKDLRSALALPAETLWRLLRS